MNIVTDPVLRGDPLWLALEHAKTAIQDDSRLFVTKEPTYEHGLNTLRINSLASDARLSDRPVFELGERVQGGVETDRWLKIHHPEIDEPIELVIWMKYGSPQITDQKVSRVLAYLDAWQQKRAVQLKPYTVGQLIRDLLSSEAAYRHNADVAARQEAKSPVSGHWFRVQAEVLRFQPDPDNMPGIRRVEAICNADSGTGLTAENVRKVHGRLCLKSGHPVEEIDALTLDAAADLWDAVSRDSQSQNEPRALIPATGKRFQVALSFSGDRRDFVKQVAHHLAATLGRDRVLYDGYYEAEFARPNLDTHLQCLYHDESELIAVFLCAGYETKEWCGLEWRAIRDLIKQRKAESVMPLRFDETRIPGLFSTDGYVWIGGRPPEEIAKLILQRLGNQSYSGGVAGPTLEPRVSTATVTGAEERFKVIREAFEEKLRQGKFGGLSKDRGAIAICLVPGNAQEIDHVKLQNAPIPPPGLRDGCEREIDEDSVIFFRERPADQALSSFIRDDVVQITTEGTILAADKWYIRRPGFPQLHSQDYISTIDFEKLVVEWLRRAAPAMQQLGIAMPWRVGVSLIDVKGFFFLAHSRQFSPRPYGSADLICKPVMFTSSEQLATSQSIASVLKPRFDSAWRAFGFACSLNYNSAGEWTC